MYAKTLPAVRVPRTLKGPFDYRIPASLSGIVTRGAIVMVPWRGREIEALVLDVAETCDIDPAKAKDISGLASLYRVSDAFIHLIEWCGMHYFASPSVVLKAIVPKTPKRKIVRDNVTIGQKADDHPLGISEEKLITYTDPHEKMSTVAEFAREAIADKASIVVVVPHTADIAPMCETLTAALDPASVVPFHGGLNAGKLWSAWDRMLSGIPCAVVGTRAAVFAPVTHLHTLVVTESESADLKQYDQNPRFDARTVAIKRSELSVCRTILMAHAPRTEEIAVARAGKWSMADTRSEDTETTLIGLSGSRTTLDDPVPDTVLEATDDALHKAKKVLFFLNRRGDASTMLCGDCRLVFRCATCKAAQTVHGTELHCHRCGATRDVPVRCDACGSVSLRRFGTGTVTLERFLKKRFPSATVVRQDAEQRSDAEGDIFIGTQLLLHDLAEVAHKGPFGLVVGLEVDGLLAHPGFRTTEEAWRSVRTLRDIALCDDARIMLTAADADDPSIRDLLLPAGEHFAREAKDREQLGYPPSATLIAIIAFGDSESAAEASAKALIVPLTHSAGDGVTVRGPMRPLTPFRHGRWRSVVALRARTMRPELITYLSSLPEQYVIDRDPEYLT